MSIRNLANSDFRLTSASIKYWLAVTPDLKNNIDNVVQITTTLADKHRGDLSGLFLDAGIPEEYHYPTLLVNDLKSFDNYDGSLVDIKIINEKVLNKYRIAIRGSE